MKKILICALLLIVAFAVGAWFGCKKIADNKQPVISGHTIVNALNDRGFLVTQSQIANQSIEITKNQDGFWNKLFWQQIIRAEAITEVNMGVDLKKIIAEDIVVENDKIIAKIPGVEIFDARVLGDINLENKQGVLKKLFESDDGYNEAREKILTQAEAAARREENIMAANQKAGEEIKRIIGYIVPDKNLEIVVEIK